jgi:hypothetical protein
MIWLNLDIASGLHTSRPKNEQDENDDDEKCRVVHVDLLRYPLLGEQRSPAAPGFSITLEGHRG